jgi:DNA-binding transcriptional ArsR family regulator
MDQQLREEVARLHAHICNGLADTIRILIIYALAEHPLNVGDLADRLGLSQPTVSRHLKTLRESGIVRAECDGQSVFYGLTDKRVVQALDLLRSMLSDHLEGQASLVHECIERFARTALRS